MSLDKIVEEAIKNAQARGEFNNLPGQGKPIDLTEYFETPEELRMAQSILKNAGITSPEVTLLQEIARLRQVLASTLDEKQKPGLEKQIREKQMEFNLRMERHKKLRK